MMKTIDEIQDRSAPMAATAEEEEELPRFADSSDTVEVERERERERDLKEII